MVKTVTESEQNRRLQGILVQRCNLTTRLYRENFLDEIGLLRAYGGALTWDAETYHFARQLIRTVREGGSKADLSEPDFIRLLRELRQHDNVMNHKEDVAFLDMTLIEVQNDHTSTPYREAAHSKANGNSNSLRGLSRITMPALASFRNPSWRGYTLFASSSIVIFLIVYILNKTHSPPVLHITKSGFVPPVIDVDITVVVIVKNESNLSCTLLIDGRRFDEYPLESGGSRNLQFDEVGIYNVSCLELPNQGAQVKAQKPEVALTATRTSVPTVTDTPTKTPTETLPPQLPTVATETPHASPTPEIPTVVEPTLTTEPPTRTPVPPTDTPSPDTATPATVGPPAPPSSGTYTPTPRVSLVPIDDGNIDQLTEWRKFQSDSFVESVAFSPLGDIVAWSGFNGVWIHDVRTDQILNHFNPYHHQTHSVTYSPDGTLLMTSGVDMQEAKLTGWIQDGTEQLWEVSAGPQGWGARMSINSSGTQLISNSAFSIIVWDLPSSGPQIRSEFTAGTGAITEDGRIFSWRDGDTIEVHRSDGSTINTVDIMNDPSGGNYTTAFTSEMVISPDNSHLASVSGNGDLVLLRTNDETIVWKASGNQVHGDGIAFSPDSRLLAVGYDDNTLRVWRVSDGKLLRDLTGHEGRITGIAFNSSGTILASGSLDSTMRLWTIGNSYP